MLKPSWLRTAITTFAAALAVGAIAAPSFAQTGPWTLTAPANPEHNTIAQTVNVVGSYEWAVTPQGGTALPPLNIGKPAVLPTCTIGTATVTNCIQADVNAFVNGLPPGTYTSTLKAIGPGGQAVSPASPSFPLTVPAPGPQGAPAVSRSPSGGLQRRR